MAWSAPPGVPLSGRTAVFSRQCRVLHTANRSRRTVNLSYFLSSFFPSSTDGRSFARPPVRPSMCTCPPPLLGQVYAWCTTVLVFTLRTWTGRRRTTKDWRVLWTSRILKGSCIYRLSNDIALSRCRRRFPRTSHPLFPALRPTVQGCLEATTAATRPRGFAETSYPGSEDSNVFKHESWAGKTRICSIPTVIADRDPERRCPLGGEASGNSHSYRVDRVINNRVQWLPRFSSTISELSPPILLQKYPLIS